MSSKVKIFEIKSTTINQLLDYMMVLDQGDNESACKVIEMTFSIKYVSQIGYISWNEASLKLVESTKLKECGISRAKSAVAWKCLYEIERFHTLQGNISTLTIPDSITEVRTYSYKIERGLKVIPAMQEGQFPKKLTHRNWQYLKIEIPNTLKALGLEWLIEKGCDFCPQLSTGICCWFKKNLANTVYEHLAVGSSSQKIWQGINEWFGHHKLDSSKKSYLRSKMDEIKLDSVETIEKFVNEYKLIIKELKEVKGDESEADLLSKIRRAAHLSPSMQANSARIDNTGIQKVSEITKIFNEIFVDLLGKDIYTVKTTKPDKKSDGTKPNKPRPRRRTIPSPKQSVTSMPEHNILPNYLAKEDYAKIASALNDEELEKFKETRQVTPKIKQILSNKADKEESQVPSKAATNLGTEKATGKRRVSALKPAQRASKKVKVNKPKEKPETTGKQDKQKKAKKKGPKLGSARRVFVTLGGEGNDRLDVVSLNNTNRAKTKSNVQVLSKKIDSINLNSYPREKGDDNEVIEIASI